MPTPGPLHVAGSLSGPGASLLPNAVATTPTSWRTGSPEPAHVSVRHAGSGKLAPHPCRPMQRPGPGASQTIPAGCRDLGYHGPPYPHSGCWTGPVGESGVGLLSTFLQRARSALGPCRGLRAPGMAGRRLEAGLRARGPFSCVLLTATLSPACAELQTALRATVLILPRKTFQR